MEESLYGPEVNNRQFIAGRVLINRKARRLQDLTVVEDRKTGKKIALARPSDFNPKHHKKLAIKVEPIPTGYDATVLTPQEIVGTVEEELDAEPPTTESSSVDRLAELKAKGWAKLSAAEREEYKRLNV